MNLLDYTRTSPARVYDLIEQLAGARGVAIAASEIVGLLPVGALTDLAQRELRAADLGPERVLENRLLVELLRRLG
jgi:glutamate formiminotransferase